MHYPFKAKLKYRRNYFFPKSVHFTFRSNASSASPPTYLPNFPFCSSLNKTALVYANYRDLSFLSLSHKLCMAERQATCLSSAGPRTRRLISLSALSTPTLDFLRLQQTSFLPLLLVQTELLTHAEATFSLWHESSAHFQSFLVFEFLSCYLEILIYYSHSQNGKASRITCFLFAYLTHFLRLRAI